MYLRLEEYHRPKTILECLRLLDNEGAALLSGGTFLNAGAHEEVRSLVDVQALPMTGVDVSGPLLRLGAGLSLSDLAAADLPKVLHALTGAVCEERNRAVRNRSTLGGRLGRNRADGRLTTALLALDAAVSLAELRHGEVHRRDVPLAQHLAEIAAEDGLAATALIVASEMPTGVLHSSYLSFSLTAVDAPFADAAIRCDRGKCRLASGGHGSDATGVLLLPESAKVLASVSTGTPEATWRHVFSDAVRDELPAYTDSRAGGEYRRELAVTLLCRLAAAWIEGKEGK